MYFVTLCCGILTLKTSDSFFRSFCFLRQNEALSATEQNQTYKNSLFFTIVSLQFSRKFYYSSCLISPHNSVKKQGKCPEIYNLYSNEKIWKKCVNPLSFDLPESHNLLENSHSYQLWI